MINAAGVPLIDADPDALDKHAATLDTTGTRYAESGADLHDTWQGLAAHYRAPEADRLFAATGPVRTVAGSVGEDTAAVGAALSAFAAEAREIRDRLDALRVAAGEFEQAMAGLPDWSADPANVDRNDRLIGEVNAAVAEYEDAQRRCANAIAALHGGMTYRPHDGDGATTADEYGWTGADIAAAAGSAEGVAWGRTSAADHAALDDEEIEAANLAAGPDPLAAVGAVGALVGNGLASLGNAVVQNPLESLAFVGGVALAGASAVGVLGGSAATATGVGAPAGVPLTGLSAAGVAAGGAIATTAGAAILGDAFGQDRIAPLGDPFADPTVPAAVATAPTMIDGLGNEWDRNGTWEALPNVFPRGEDIAHTPTSRTHIPYGEHYENGRSGGGHLWDSGVPDKTVFPEDWPAQRMLDTALDVARNPDHPPQLKEELIGEELVERWTVEGRRDGVDVRVVLNKDGGIVTAYPLGGSGVGVNDEYGEPRLLDGN